MKELIPKHILLDDIIASINYQLTYSMILET